MIILPNGIAVLDGDTHISKWIAETGELCHDRCIKPLAELIHPGDTVIDVGAFIGDHTTLYLNAVGPEGTVIAIEPNPDAFECLEHNCPKARAINAAASDSTERVSIVVNANVGASHVKPEITGEIESMMIDHLHLTRCDFIKIDAEGFECRVIAGAIWTIRNLKPRLYIEVNRDALIRSGYSREELFRMLVELGYEWRIWQDNCNAEDPQYDILCERKA